MLQFLLCPLFALHAAPPCVEISRTYADLEINPQSSGVALRQTPDGGYIVAGTRRRSSEREDVYLLKLDRQGAPEWDAVFGGPDDDDYSFGVELTSGGGYAVLTILERRCGILFLDARGELLSRADLVSACSLYSAFTSFEASADGGYFVAGVVEGSSWNLFKTDASGTVEWTRDFGLRDYQARPTPDGGVIVSSQGPEYYTLGLHKLSGTGDVEWEKFYQRISEGLALYGGALQPAPEGGYLLAGNAEYTASKARRLYLLRTDDRGEQLWDKVFDDRPNRAHSLREGAGGTFVMGTDGRSLFGVDGSGEITWERKFSLAVGGVFADIERTSDGGHAAIASGLGSRPAGLLLVKLAPLPGEAQVFRRGEANDDGAVDISDSVWILNALFLGEVRLACRDAADFNDDGAVDISDAIGELTFPFLGGPPAPLPGRTGCCGADPTADGMTCETLASCG